MDRVPVGGVRFIIAVVCGNDWYDANRVQPLGADVLSAADSLCARMRDRSQEQFAVIGASSETWGYSGWMDLASQRQYDENTRVFIERFSVAGVPATSGAGELRGITLADSIGHVLASSWDIVFEAYRCWVFTCCASEPRGSSPEDSG